MPDKMQMIEESKAALAVAEEATLTLQVSRKFRGLHHDDLGNVLAIVEVLASEPGDELLPAHLADARKKSYCLMLVAGQYLYGETVMGDMSKEAQAATYADLYAEVCKDVCAMAMAGKFPR